MLALLHLSDPTLPIGGFSHSGGLETYVQSGQVHDVKTAESYVRSMLEMNLQYNDAAFMSLAFTEALQGNLNGLLKLDEELSAFKVPSQLMAASQKLGIRLMKIFKRSYNFQLINNFELAINNKSAAGHYCILFGIYAALLDIKLEDALTAFYYNAAVGMVTNLVKLVPLGQLDGQDILHKTHPLIGQLVIQTMAPEVDMLGRCNTGFDIAAMQHERLYSRLYMS